jgi:hypothetical protein
MTDRRTTSILSEITADVFGLVGFASMVVGLWMAWPPLAFIIGGALLLAVYVRRESRPAWRSVTGPRREKPQMLRVAR